MLLSFTVILLHNMVPMQTLSENETHSASEAAVNIDGQLITLTRKDNHQWGFNPSANIGEDSYDENYYHDTTFSAANDTDYNALYHQLFRRSRDDDEAKRTTCMDNLQKFRMLAKNRPLQFVVVVDTGGNTRLTCHFCEDGDKIRESKEWDGREQAEGKPLWRNPSSIRSPILWYRIRHFGTQNGFRLTEIKPSMHDDEEANRIYITTGHTLVINKAEPDDAGTYFCRDTRTKDKLVGKAVLMEWEIREMMSNRGAFRFLIHLDVLQKVDVKLEYAKSESMSIDKNDENNVQLVNVWGPWSPCNTCDLPGEKRRRGVCTVKKLHDDREAKPWYVNAVLTAQATGVPCRSSLFHTQYEDIRHNKAFFRPDYVTVKTCKVPCKRRGFFKQLLSKKALSPKGLKSIISREKKSKAKVKTLNETAGTDLTLECPGTSLDMGVMWVNDSRYMPAATLVNKTGGRVSVDVNGSLHISPLTRWDRGLYLCMAGGTERGHVYLNVTETVEDDFAYYGMWVVYSIPVDFVIFFFLMVVKHIHRKRILISSEEAGPPDDDEDDDGNNSNINTSSCMCPHRTWSPQSSDETDFSPMLLASSKTNPNISRSSSNSSFQSTASKNSGSSSSSRSCTSRGTYGYPSQTNI